ncbi:hypothetical protein LCGC14_2636770, partial [marine sediment metagenome]
MIYNNLEYEQRVDKFYVNQICKCRKLALQASFCLFWSQATYYVTQMEKKEK